MTSLLHRVAQFRALRAFNRGTLLLDTDPDHAHRHLLAAAAHAPYTPIVWLNLGNAFMNDGDCDSALGCYRRAMHLAPNDPQPQVNAAIALLTLGQWEEGWRMYEARFALPEFQLRNGLKGGDPAKMWRGESLKGKTLLVFNEQGAGDTIMCLRYDQKLRDLYDADRVIYRVPASLLRLARANVGRDNVVSDTERLPDHDFLIPFMSLPFMCSASHRVLPNPDGYLRVRCGFDSNSALRVGVVWAGSPAHKNDSRRSISIKQLAPLFRTQHASFISLQAGGRSSDAIGVDRLETIRNPPIDYYDTACVLQTLDLIVSVDTSVAHLAGALGLPCWIMLPYVADFRWMRDRRTSPWYHTVRLFRQPARGDWATVVADVCRQLALDINPMIS